MTDLFSKFSATDCPAVCVQPQDLSRACLSIKKMIINRCYA